MHNLVLFKEINKNKYSLLLTFDFVLELKLKMQLHYRILVFKHNLVCMKLWDGKLTKTICNLNCSD